MLAERLPLINLDLVIDTSVQRGNAILHDEAILGLKLCSKKVPDILYAELTLQIYAQVENCVVGAPCGAMDQLTSTLGQAGSLLALRCQPAEMLDPIAVPPSIRLWGIDSGIRHR